jgi:hypothetical protein
VDRPRRTLAVFDQLEAKADFEDQNLTIGNMTPYDAAVTIAVETNQQARITLPAGQARTISLKTLL